MNTDSCFQCGAPADSNKNSTCSCWTSPVNFEQIKKENPTLQM